MHIAIYKIMQGDRLLVRARSGLITVYTIGMYCFTAKHAS